MRVALFILPLAALAACSTPREQCISSASRDIRIINSLVAQTEANLARGYGIEERQELRSRERLCRGERSDRTTFTTFCTETETVTTQQAVALDLNAERAKLASLRERQVQAQAAADQAVRQCVAIHPE